MNHKTDHDDGLSNEERLQKLRERRRNRPIQINDTTLPAGSPMHYYCLSCGHLADVLPEDWFETPPRKLCLDCQKLKDLGLLEK